MTLGEIVQDYCHICKEITKQQVRANDYHYCLENKTIYGIHLIKLKKLDKPAPIIIKNNYEQFVLFLIKQKAMKHEYKYMDRMTYLTTLANLAKDKGWDGLSCTNGQVKIGLYSITYWLDGHLEPRTEINWYNIALRYSFVKIMFGKDWKVHFKELMRWDNPIMYYVRCLDSSKVELRYC